MTSTYSTKTTALLERLHAFFDEHIYPNEERYHDEMEALRRAGDPWQPVPLIEELKPKARAAGLWNMFLPHPVRAARAASRTSTTRRCAR